MSAEPSAGGGKIVVIGRGAFCLVRVDAEPPRRLGEIAGRADEAWVLSGEYDAPRVMDLARDYLHRQHLDGDLYDCPGSHAIANLPKQLADGWQHLPA